MRKISYLAPASAAVHLLSFVLMLYQVEPFYTFFFQLAWWSYILVLAGLNESRHGNAVLLRGRGELFWLAGISVGAWLG
ncbi:MAG: hypothetical protein JSU96_03560, partial [Acidobacteriota bacterium]